MTTVKFDKSVKYKGLRHAAHEVFEVDNEDVEQLKKDGATVISEDVKEPEHTGDEDDADTQEGKSDEDVTQLKETLLNFTVPELVKFAEENGIDIKGKNRKADIYNIIVAAL